MVVLQCRRRCSGRQRCWYRRPWHGAFSPVGPVRSARRNGRPVPGLFGERAPDVVHVDCADLLDELLQGRLGQCTGYPVAAPADWQPGEDVIIGLGVDDEDAARRFPRRHRVVKPYLHLTASPDLTPAPA